MLTPTIGRYPGRARSARSRKASAAAPWLLNPIRLTSARSSGNRNIRGFGLPGCGRAVTVPTSTKPNPSAASPMTPAPSLSNPAASPSGPGKSSPNARTRSEGSRGPRTRRSAQARPGTSAAARISQNAARWAASAGNRRSSTA